MSEAKPFLGWDKTPAARAQYKTVLRNPADPRFSAVAIELLTKTTDQKMVFEYMPKETLVQVWPYLRPKLSGVVPRDSLVWWDSIVSTLRSRYAREKDTGDRRPARAKEPDPILSDLGLRFRIRRKHAGATIEDYAKRLKTTQAILSKLERGLYNPTYKWLMDRSDVILGDDVYMPPLYPTTPYPTRIERMANGSIVWTDGNVSLDLTHPTRPSGFLSLADNAADFFDRLYTILSGAEKTVWDGLHQRIRSKGVSIPVMYKVLHTQYQMLFDRQTGQEHLSRMAAQNRLEAIRVEIYEKYADKKGAGLWVALAPVHIGNETPRVVDLQKKKVVAELFQLLRIPEVGGIREAGWNPRSLNDPRVDASGDFVQFGNPHLPFRPFRVYRDGTVVFLEPDQKLLEWKRPEQLDMFEGKHALYPYAAVEYPVSFFRYVTKVWKKFGMAEHTQMAVGEIVFGPAADWVLLPDRPESVNYLISAQMLAQSLKSPISPYIRVRRPYHISSLIDKPDFNAWQLIVPFYEAFGHGYKSIPFYRAEEGKFDIP